MFIPDNFDAPLWLQILFLIFIFGMFLLPILLVIRTKMPTLLYKIVSCILIIYTSWLGYILVTYFLSKDNKGKIDS